MGWVSYREDIIERQTDNMGWYYCPEHPTLNEATQRAYKQNDRYYYPLHDPPKKNKQLAYIPTAFEHEDPPYDEDAHKQLRTYLRKLRYEVGVTREWLNTYFDLVKQLLDSTKLVSSDLRLLMSLTSNTPGVYGIRSYRSFLHITMHLRYVFLGYQCENNPPSVAVIYPTGAWHNAPEAMQKSVYMDVVFTNKPVAHLLHLNSIGDVASFKEGWIREAYSEKVRGKALTRCRYPKSQKPMFYKAVVNADYRAKLLELV